jgi:hypothetical protein
MEDDGAEVPEEEGDHKYTNSSAWTQTLERVSKAVVVIKVCALCTSATAVGRWLLACVQ